MKTDCQKAGWTARHSTLVLGLLLACCFAANVFAEEPLTTTNSTTRAVKAKADASQLSAKIVIQKSVFVVPATPEEGRNPFFPEAKVTAQVPKEKERTLDSSVFVLNGITGPPLRSAMINGRTFFAGEEGEVRLENGAKVLIKCSEVRDESAVIIVGGVQRELRLRFGI